MLPATAAPAFEAGLGRWLLPALLALTCAAPPTAQAQALQWQQRYDQALREHAARAYGAAEAAASEALALARGAPGPRQQPYVASSLNLLGMIAQDQGRHADAVELLEQALVLAEASLGAHANTASMAWNLGNALVATGRGSDAVPHYRRSLEIAESRLGQAGMPALRERLLPVLARLESHPLLAQAGQLNERALGHAQREEYAQAAALFAQAQQLIEAHAPEDPALARLLASRARMAQALRQDDAARALFGQALERWRRQTGAEALMGEADALNGLASLLYRKRRFQDARDGFAQALERMEQAVGADDARLLPLLDNLAALHRSQGGYGVAPAARRAALIRAAQRDAAAQ